MITKVKISDQDILELNKIIVDQNTQINDIFDYSKVIVRKPWGYEYLIYQNEYIAVWILHIKNGFQTSMHCHPNKKTSLVILSGEALCSSLQGDIERKAGDGLLIDKGVFHRTHSTSPEGIFLMEIETPVNKRDLVRYKDSYGRVGMGYETIDQMSFNIQNYNYISFIEPEFYYNVKKRFGNCSISLAKFKDNSDFQNNFMLDKWDTVSILKGKILDENRNIILDVGDTIDYENLIQKINFGVENELEVIMIKKNDSMIKVSDFVISFLEKQKCNNIFLVPGSANVHLLDSIGRNTNVQHISTQTEEAATMAAEAYAKYKGEIGVAIIASGSSTTRGITGVADAWIDSTPLLIISGQSDESKENSELRQLGNQELDIINIVKPITKYAVKVKEASKIKYHLEHAMYLAKTGRYGPVWIDIPIDIQGMNINESELDSFIPLNSKKDDNNPILIRDVNKTLELLNGAERPIILAGNGIRLAGCEKEFIDLVNSLSIPVLTSKRGTDLIPDDSSLYFGRPGAYGQRAANFIIQNSDLIICIGTRLSIPLIGRNYQSFARSAKKVIVDIDPAELGKKTVKPNLAINACAGEFIKELLKRRNYLKPKNIQEWTNSCINFKNKYASEDLNNNHNNNFVEAYFFIQKLSEELKENATITIDAGTPLIFALQKFLFKKGQRLISASGLENPSFALPASIGAYVGKQNGEIICICDDRGFQKNIQELETIVNYKLPIKIFILNSKGYSYVRKTQEFYFGQRYVASDNETGFFSPNILEIAKAYNIPTFSIKNHDNINSIIKNVLNNSGPTICEINLDKDQQIKPRITFTVKNDGKWCANPLEDMFPFLDKKEFKENMRINLLEEEKND